MPRTDSYEPREIVAKDGVFDLPKSAKVVKQSTHRDDDGKHASLVVLVQQYELEEIDELDYVYEVDMP